LDQSRYKPNKQLIMNYAMIFSLFFLFAEKARAYYYTSYLSDFDTAYLGGEEFVNGFSRCSATKFFRIA